MGFNGTSDDRRKSEFIYDDSWGIMLNHAFFADEYITRLCKGWIFMTGRSKTILLKRT